MNFSKIDYSTTLIKEYRVHGCRRPSEREPQPQIFVSTLFAINPVFARASFAKLLNKQHKIKQTECEILNIEEVPQDDDFELKNYGIDFVYRTKNGLQNGYKETRNINKVLAVWDLYQEVGTHHKIPHSQVSILNIRVLKDEEVKKAKILSYTGNDVAFPVFGSHPNTKKEYVPHTVDIFN